MELVYLITGLLLGVIAGVVYTRKVSSNRLALQQEELGRYRQEKAKTEEENKAKDEMLLELNRALATKTADLNNLADRFREHRQEMEKIQEVFSNHFKNLANEILEEKSRKFTEQNRQKLDELLLPLGEKIRNFEKKVEETYDKESKERFALDREVKRLAELNKQISEDASRLTEALKGESKTQGNWGEMILENILEKSGLVRDREYAIQESLTTDDGRRLQPDVIVRLPGNRHVIIDAKVSLTAYERYTSTEQEEQRQKHLKEHLLSVRNHIQELSGKSYQDAAQIQSPDFVMMFMPVEPAYMLAIQADQDIWNYAYEKRILLISPTNLLVSLKMIASLWRQEYQAKNVMEIARQSGDLLDKFYALLNDLTDLGARMHTAQKSYDDAMSKLSTGKGNLIRRAEKIRELGARTKKTLPENFSGSLNGEHES
jgi:DNA recombination protein RmuC